MGWLKKAGGSLGRAVAKGLGIDDDLQSAWEGITGKTQANAIEEAANVQDKKFQQILGLLQPGVDFQQAQYPLLSENASIEGFGNRMNSIMNSDALQPFFNTILEQTQHSLANAGARTSGAAPRALSDSLLNAAMGIEGNLAGRTQTNAGLASNATGMASNVMNQQGNNAANSILGQSAAGLGGLSNLLNLGGGMMQGGMGGGGMGGLLQGGLMALFGLSDERLKKNIKTIATKGNLDIIEWEWNEKAEKLYDLKGKGMGVSANQVRRLYPQHAYPNNDGFLTVDYAGLAREVA